MRENHGFYGCERCGRKIAREEHETFIYTSGSILNSSYATVFSF
jgi:hypothetical protein